MDNNKLIVLLALCVIIMIIFGLLIIRTVIDNQQSMKKIEVAQKIILKESKI